MTKKTECESVIDGELTRSAPASQLAVLDRRMQLLKVLQSQRVTMEQLTPAMTCRLGCYKKLAMNVLVDLCCCRTLIGVDSDVSVRVQLDGEIAFIKWQGEKMSDSAFRGHIAESLDDYVAWGASFKTSKRLIEPAPCLKLIVLGRDEEAKKLDPAAYRKLKGKPLNPIQVAAVEAIIAEGRRLDAEDPGSIMEFSLHEFYQYGISLAECHFSGEKLSLAKKLVEIRRW